MGKSITTNDKELIIKSFVSEAQLQKACWTTGKFAEGFDVQFSENPFKNQGEENKQKVYRYITNPDGSVRWIFSDKAIYPGFLDLYNSTGWKAYAFTLICSLLFFFRVSFLVAPRKFYVLTKGAMLQDEWKNKQDFDSFSVFTGTVGPNRKVVFALHKGQETVGFIKHPISYKSMVLVAHENVVLNYFKNSTFSTFSIPASNYLGNGDLFISNMRKSNMQSEADFTDKHALALQELYSQSSDVLPLDKTNFYHDLRSLISKLKSEGNVPYQRNLFYKLYQLFQLVNKQQEVSCAWAHMDFTPWNLFADRKVKRLSVIDWELSKPGIPLLFDLFHFVFQSKILLGNKGFKYVFQELNCKVKNMPHVQGLIKKYNIDFDFHYRLYLLYNIAYYLGIYQKQEKLHVQVRWLTRVWDDALTTELNRVNEQSYRKVFIVDIFEFLSDKNYVWLHACNQKTKNIKVQSDIDLLVDTITQHMILDYCKSHALIMRTKKLKKSFMESIELFFLDGSFLSLDLITKFARKNLIFMDAEQVLRNSVRNSKGIKIPSLEDDLNYLMLFYSLNSASIPLKYHKYYSQLGAEQRKDLLGFLKTEYRIVANDLANVFSGINKYQNRIRNKISKGKVNRGFLFVRNTINYLLDVLREVTSRRGFVVTFSGVDGAGKSTLINDLVTCLKKNYRKKVIVLRHRPSVLPILSSFKYGKKEAERRAARILPHQGTNKSILSSIFRFTYYFIDYVFGQFYVSFRYVLRNYIVIYDRYYFDFINDSERSNIVLPKGFVRKLYFLVFKPKHNFFLYAKPEIIRARKKELSENEITQLTGNYLEMFARFQRKYQSSEYHCIENVNRDQTLNKIVNHVIEAI